MRKNPFSWHGFSTRAFLLLTLPAASSIAAPVEDKVPDHYASVPFEQQHLTAGLFADRMKVNLEDRLLKVDEHAILDGFVHRPGNHPWIGEHAGKFLDAAANTYRYTHDERLKVLMDRVANTLMGAQLPDGYLGTYSDDKRWTSWDVWSHKYDLIGLLAWYDVTKDQRALDCCRKIGDLLSTTFGDAPGQRDLSDSGEQAGMAATSVLEPMCYLYRHTGDKKYLDFCYYITRNIEKHSKVISSLTEGKGVEQTANAKAYEMLSNLLGLIELYRLTGDQTFLTPAVNGWTDIVRHDHLYVTGTASTFEHFRAPGDLPAAETDDVGEGCVTVTWIQMNLSLLRLTGDPRYADQIERSIYNQLLGAQDAENGDICYYTPLIGHKPYSHNISCCVSSEPRGISMIPLCVWGITDNTIMLNLFAAGHASFTVPATDGKPVTVEVTSTTDFPISGKVQLMLKPSRQATVAFAIRVPSWCSQIDWPGGDSLWDHNTYGKRMIDLPAAGKTFELHVAIPVEFKHNHLTYPNSFAIQRGPQVLAFEASENPKLPIPASATVDDVSACQIDKKAVSYTFDGYASLPDAASGKIVVTETPIKLIPFANARVPIVWMPAKDHLVTGPLPVTFGGKESYSRAGRARSQGPITDMYPDTMHVTFNKQMATQDWYAVELAKPAAAKRIVFRHGKCFHDGGWFDTSAGKPQVQIRATATDAWKTVGELADYPATTATNSADIKEGQSFEISLPEATVIQAIRVVGKPATGDNPKQAFSTCSELAAYAP